MGRVKDWFMEMQEKYPNLSNEEIIEQQKRTDDYIENCIEQENISKN